MNPHVHWVRTVVGHQRRWAVDANLPLQFKRTPPHTLRSAITYQSAGLLMIWRTTSSPNHAANSGPLTSCVELSALARSSECRPRGLQVDVPRP